MFGGCGAQSRSRSEEKNLLNPFSKIMRSFSEKTIFLESGLSFSKIISEKKWFLPLHFPSGPISLATPASLSSAQEPLLLSSLLPVTSLFNWQTTQLWLATPKLPQPRVYLIHIAATLAIHSFSVTAAHREARPLVLAVLVRNVWGRVSHPLDAGNR